VPKVNCNPPHTANNSFPYNDSKFKAFSDNLLKQKEDQTPYYYQHLNGDSIKANSVYGTFGKMRQPEPLKGYSNQIGNF
jgi:hypothetical protein